MRTKFTFLVAALVILASACPSQAPQAGKMYRIGYLATGKPATYAARYEAIRQALRKLGYIEGRNVTSLYRYADGKRDRQPALAADLARLKVDIIIVAAGDTMIRAAKKATKTIPIIMTGPGSNPVEAGFIASLAHPGGNITGITTLNRMLGSKRLALLKDVVPRLARVAVLYDPTVPGTTREVKEELPVAARALGLTIQLWEVRRTNDFDRIFAALKKERPSGLYVPGGGSAIRSNEKRIARFALRNRLPAIYAYRRVVAAGGLMSYAADIADSYRHVATYVDRILRGANPADLPVEQPTKFELLVNLKTAKTLGITVPSSILVRADEVIE